MTVVLAAYNVASHPAGGGHFWVYMQYVHGLRQLGCDVYWMEDVAGRNNSPPDMSLVEEFAERMARHGMGGKLILYENRPAENGDTIPHYFGISSSAAEAVFRHADLLLNFHYAIDPALLARFRRTSLVDIDPGLLQTWMSTGELVVPQHDVYFTTGETVGTPSARFPDCGIAWRHFRPPVCLQQWPAVACQDYEAFTTVSAWWTTDWLKEADGTWFDNNKRVSFLQFLELPRYAKQPIELALCLDHHSPHDLADRQLLERHGWRVRHSSEVARTPEMYQAYIQQSRGEFSCAKPSCMKFQGAWVSDRTLCYLASGKPAVVQHTGPSSFLPNGDGMFRFSTLAEAVSAFETINSNYERHCRAAREIAETYFDSTQVAASILDQAFGAAETALPCATVRDQERAPQIHEH